MTGKEAIVFIDGNNVYHNLKATWIRPGTIDLKKLALLACSQHKCKLKRIIYYNSVPSIEDGKDIYYAQMKFLDELRKQGIEVKTRKLQRHSNHERIKIVHDQISNLGLCKLCDPVVKTHWKDYIGNVDVKEKGVDILISTDMLKLCLVEKECDDCILISGDADFIPCLDLLHSAGKFVASASTAKGYSYELRNKHKWFILDKQLIIDKCSKDH